jgi:hypothetical protein
MLPITVAVIPEGFVLSSLTALLAPITLVAASAVVLTLALLVVGIVSEGAIRCAGGAAPGRSRREADAASSPPEGRSPSSMRPPTAGQAPAAMRSPG